MTRYASLVGKRVEAEYRTADIYLTAVGILVSDTGKSIFLEERFSHGGREKTMRVEIPYQYLIRIAEKPLPPPNPPSHMPTSPKKKR